MNKNPVTQARIIRMTIDTIRGFYSRNPDMNTAPMADNFMWIGANDFQWCESLKEFLRVTKKEYEEPPVMLSDEEFHLLFHERNVWVVYGRYKISTVLEDGSAIYAHVRGTYVWRRLNGELKLLHVHGSHAQDIPLNQIAPPKEPLTEDSPYFDYLKHMNSLNSNTDKISFRDRDGRHRYLFPAEILYIKADGQHSIVVTKTGDFQATGILASHEAKLPPFFRRIQKSYIVNTHYIDSIYRYKAILQDGQELPIGKDWYMGLKKSMKG